MQVSYKKWVISFLIVFGIMLLGTGALTVIIDPCFHYHKPLKNIQYPMSNQRYINNGILKNFDYDAMIIGTSMTENFKVSEFNELFGVNSIKVPFPAATYKEINDNVMTAAAYNPNLKAVLRCLDFNKILTTADAMSYAAEDYPEYLYDDILYNDIKYIFNKAILFEETLNVIQYTINGGTTPDFDSYASWGDYDVYGKDALIAGYERPEKSDEILELTDEDYQNITENITRNIIQSAEEHPEIEFYLYFSPYSIYYWDMLNQEGDIKRNLDAEKYIIELLLPYDNIHLFSFFTNYELICGLDNYKDIYHYGKEINSQILIWIKEGEYEITEENYENYCGQIKEFYMNYDYDSLFE